MNYQDLQYKYSKSKKKKQSKLVKADYKLTKSHFTANEWKDYKDWIKEMKHQENVLERSKSKKCKTTKAKGKKALKTSGNSIKKKPLTYQDQLKDERWLKKRKEVLDTKGYVCSMCGARYGLQVHHLKYKKGKMAWEYPMSDLIVVCDKCHKKIHNIN